MKPHEARGSSRSLAAAEAGRSAAIQRRDRTTAGLFFFGVKTTGVYCRPGCPARMPKSENIDLFQTREEAENAGFRPCKRCRPEEIGVHDRESEIVAEICRRIERADHAPKLAELASGVGLSPHYVHRLFKRTVGVTPRAYAEEERLRRVRGSLRSGQTVTAAMYDAGYHASSRFYENAGGMLGMTPREYREGGRGTDIRHAIVPCSLGLLLVAATPKGICAVRFGDDPELLESELSRDYPHARLIRGDAAFDAWVEEVVALVDKGSAPNAHLPLDIQGTAFQRRVWEALRRIRAGETANYAEIAARVGAPKASRAVGGACASNPLAVLIPCHRVIRRDGSLGGYRWGIERKKRLLQREREDAPA